MHYGESSRNPFIEADHCFSYSSDLHCFHHPIVERRWVSSIHGYIPYSSTTQPQHTHQLCFIISPANIFYHVRAAFSFNYANVVCTYARRSSKVKLGQLWEVFSIALYSQDSLSYNMSEKLSVSVSEAHIPTLHPQVQNQSNCLTSTALNCENRGSTKARGTHLGKQRDLRFCAKWGACPYYDFCRSYNAIQPGKRTRHKQGPT